MKFCTSCGTKLRDNSSFCGSCGTQSSEEGAAKKSQEASPSTTGSHSGSSSKPGSSIASYGSSVADGSMGKLIISGKGEDVSTAGSWIFAIVVAAVIIFLGFIAAEWFGYVGYRQGRWGVRWVRTDAYYVLLWGSIIIAAIFFIFSAYKLSLLSKTKIHVFENGIKGMAITKDDISVQDFNLWYDRVASVDSYKNTKISINAYGKEFTVVASNSGEIAEAINSKLRQVRSSTASS